ncbi:MAG: hypothetical protein J6Y48_11780 [Clostridia bacterium]|nr:hypothetical protein [Clostridia bacterium]
MDNEKPATVSVFAYESALMHKDADCDRMLHVVRIIRNICFVLCAVVVIITVTLVGYYTSRTAMWNDTITKLTTTLAEVTNGVYQQSDP